jgi:hypothetical protein
MSYDNLSSVSQNVLKFYQQLTGEERRIPFIFDDFFFNKLSTPHGGKYIFIPHLYNIVTTKVY